MLEPKFEVKDRYLLVTVTGRVTVSETLAIYQKACDLAAETGLNRVLVDAFAVEGDLTTMERYILGQTMAKYSLDRSINPRVATIGLPPLVDGFGTHVAANRGVTTATFSDRKRALSWLAAFDQDRSHRADPGSDSTSTANSDGGSLEPDGES